MCSMLTRSMQVRDSDLLNSQAIHHDDRHAISKWQHLRVLYFRSRVSCMSISCSQRSTLFYAFAFHIDCFLFDLS